MMEPMTQDSSQKLRLTVAHTFLLPGVNQNEPVGFVV